MRKKLTIKELKVKRDAEQKERKLVAIKLMLYRVLCGAQGGWNFSDDPLGDDWFMSMEGIELFGRFMGALKNHVLKQWIEENNKECFFDENSFNKFENLHTAAEYLWGLGYREE